MNIVVTNTFSKVPNTFAIYDYQIMRYVLRPMVQHGINVELYIKLVTIIQGFLGGGRQESTNAILAEMLKAV